MRRTQLILTALTCALVAPSTAAAQSVVSLEDGVAVYRGGPGGNAVTATAPAADSVWSDALQPLVPGPGCFGGPLVTCPSVSMDARLGAGDDRADIGGSGESFALVTGGKGRDRILARAGGNDVSAGAGDDAVTISSEGPGVARGGDGDDTLLTEEGSGRLFGGPGRDLAVGSASAVLIDGGDGDDDLVTFGRDASGGAGRDVLIGHLGGGHTFDGGLGGDWIVGDAGPDTVLAGDGGDVVDVSGDEGAGPDTVSCGAGFDTVYADPDDDVAADCERRVAGPMPTAARVVAAEAAAQHLLDNPNPLT